MRVTNMRDLDNQALFMSIKEMFYGQMKIVRRNTDNAQGQVTFIFLPDFTNEKCRKDCCTGGGDRSVYQ